MLVHLLLFVVQLADVVVMFLNSRSALVVVVVVVDVKGVNAVVTS